MGFVNVDMRNFDGYGEFGRSRFRRITHAISAPIRMVAPVIKAVAAPVVKIAKPIVKTVVNPIASPMKSLAMLAVAPFALAPTLLAKAGLDIRNMKKQSIGTDPDTGQEVVQYQDENGNVITEEQYKEMVAKYAAEEQRVIAAGHTNIGPGMSTAGESIWKHRYGLKTTPRLQIAPQTVVDNLPQGMPATPGPTGAAMQKQSPTSYVEKAIAIKNGSQAAKAIRDEMIPDMEIAPPSAEPQDVGWAAPFLSKEHLQGEVVVDTFGRYQVKRKRQISLGERRSDMLSNFRRGRGSLGRRFNGGIEFTSGSRPLQYGPISFKGFDDVTGAWTPDAPSSGNWLTSITDLATRGKKVVSDARAASSAIRDIGRANRASSRPQVPALPGAPIARPNTIMGMPPMAVYTGAGLLLAGSIAYFAFKKK